MCASKIPFTRKINNFMTKPCAEVQTVTVKEICLTRRDNMFSFVCRTQISNIYSFKSGSYPYVCVHVCTCVWAHTHMILKDSEEDKKKGKVMGNWDCIRANTM